MSYKYSINSDGLTSTVTQAAGAKVSFTPTRAGSHTLYVQSIDKAGWTSALKKYHFSVKPATKKGFWRFTEEPGSLTAESSPVLEASATPDAPLVGPLTLSSGSLWDTGPISTVNPAFPGDRALRFSDVSNTAATSGPAIDTSKSYTVMAQLYMTKKTNYATAVSQDGNITSGFKFGVREDSCNTADGRCWGFWMSDADDYGASVTKVMADGVPVVINRWVHLTGVYDATARTMKLFICDIGAAGQQGDGVPRLVGTTSNVGSRTWSAGGPFRLGRAVADGQPAHEWPGLVDDVQVFDGVIDEGKLRNGCRSYI